MPLGTMFPNVDASQIPYFNGAWAAEQQGSAMQNNKLNQIGALQDLFKNQAMIPLDVEGKRLSNEQTGLTNTGLGMKNEDAAMSLDMRKKAAPQEYEAMVTKMAQEIDDGKMKLFNNQIQRLAYSQDPRERAMGSDMMNMSKDILAKREELKLQGSNSMAVAKEHSRSALEVAKTNQEGANARAAGRVGTGKGEAALAAKMGYEKASVYYFIKAQEAEAEGDAEGAAKAYAQANVMKEAFERAKILAAQQGQAGKPDLSDPSMNIPTRPGATPQGFPAPTQPSVPSSGQPSAYQSSDDVRAAVKQGRLSRDAALKILRDQFGMK